MAQVMKLLARKAATLKSQTVALVMEQWVDKRFDFNYQFVIAKDGTVHFNFVKEAITDRGVHQGHAIPSRLTPQEVQILVDASRAIGKRMYQDGYYGVVGVDGIAAQDGALYPNLEINARFNMSTYQSLLQEQFVGDGKCALVKNYPLKLTKKLSFLELRHLLKDVLFSSSQGTGVLITNFAAVNAAYEQQGTLFPGRLYTMVIAESWERIRELNSTVEARLSHLEKGALHEAAV
jgi:hypothetical protein